MSRTISSAQTFAMKFVFPVVWLGAFGVQSALLFGASDHFSGRPPPPEVTWVFLGVLLLGCITICWWCLRLKRVVMTDSELRISNYLREIAVPLSDIDEVTENRWVSLHPVTIQFVRRTDFGHRILFMPKTRPFAFFSSHPIVAELRTVAATSKREPLAAASSGGK